SDRVLAVSWRGDGPGFAVGDGAADDADAVGGPEPRGSAGVGELAGDVLAVLAGPGEEAAGVVGQGGQGTFAAVGHGGKLRGTAADDGGQVGGRAGPAGSAPQRVDGLTWACGASPDDLAGKPGGHAAWLGGV